MARKAEPKATAATPKRRAPRGTARPATARAWQPAFLAALAEHCNVRAACRAAGVGREAAYDLRRADPAFAAAWETALEEGVELLEEEVRRRALHGVSEPVFYRGAECGTIQRYSDTLAIFLLKAHRPKVYRDSAAGTDDDPVTHRHTVEYVNDWRGAGRGDG